MGGSMYLATFVDDYSSLSVVCPIKAKSDVAGVTIDVINMLEKQSGCPLLVVCSDNGSEYINSTLGTFFNFYFLHFLHFYFLQLALQESKCCFRATTPPIDIHSAPSLAPAPIRPVHPNHPRCISFRQILSRRPLRQP